MRTKRTKRAAAFLAGLMTLQLAACGGGETGKVISIEKEEDRVVNFFSPMEKSDPDAENVARTASELTVTMAEEALGVTMAYRTYTAESYQDKTYDDVALDRARNNMDDIYLLNPDKIGRAHV